MNAYVKATDAFFIDLAVELQNALDLHPAGITQETAWLHFKRLGRKVSVDQIVTALNTMVRDGALTGDKNHKNETVWRRVRTAAPLTVTVQQQRPAPSVAAGVIHPEPIALEPPPPTPTAAIVEEQPPMPSRTTLKTSAAAPVAAHGPGSGERIELSILSALAKGPHTRKMLMTCTGASGTGVDNALSRLVERKAVRRGAGVRGLWELQGAMSAPTPAPAATSRPAKSTAKARSASPDATVEASIQRFSTRLQPVDGLATKLAALDQLAAVMPKPIAEVLFRIRGDLARLADA